ncbi:VOC family protein [Paenibacillus daejeonensis]|uniref:VOC family protein n=1 Tax=Paenibacillus daejeonensis TaxID=135193 RepID=UPI000376C1B0|nr:VOC family protein [Paenibacillus daejeonensis]
MNHYEADIDGYTLIQLPVADLAKSLSFYKDLLGFVEENPQSELDKNRFLRVRNGGGEDGRGAGPTLHLLVTDAGHLKPTQWEIDGQPIHALELHSKNITALHERLSAAGVRIIEKPYFTPPAGGYLKFLDPDSHLICVNQAEEYTTNEETQAGSQI